MLKEVVDREEHQNNIQEKLCTPRKSGWATSW